MDKDEAIIAMQTGNRVTHRFFTEDEWITMEDNQTIITEEGYRIFADEFWDHRKGIEWQSGWSLYKTKPAATGSGK
jgi:hypothetical protein